jgi:hypothetical protein
MYTKQALHELGVATDLTGSQKQKLDDDGFFIVEGMLSRDDCTSMSKEFENIHASERHKAAMRCMSNPARGACPTFSTRRRRTTNASSLGSS